MDLVVAVLFVQLAKGGSTATFDLLQKLQGKRDRRLIVRLATSSSEYLSR